ncbi:methyl-accepting chemotaxis protein [Paenibacillus sp. IHBB 10380]|uniref:methyl-accepting chemotaxis protein n=1 Tax=Paenibacillus sp. IHBB 10380 TaxID=1566358 RepID=UPI0005CFC7C5|nr:methyl-accepting chemotaxis protein [Paenibacillus sp. IHBB 10380]AJS57564.1 chemotaxis protein [Paenibacillus sp. IHBB 10380]
MGISPKKEIKKDKVQDKVKKVRGAIKDTYKNPGGVKRVFKSVRQVKKFNPSKSVGVKLFLIFFIAIISFVLLVGILSYSKAKGVIEKNAANANEQTLIQTADKLELIFNQFEESSLQIFFDNDMQDLLNQLSGNNSDYDLFVLNDKIEKKLVNLSNGNESIKGLFIVPPDEKQRPFSTGSISTKLETVRSQEWYEKLKEKNVSSWFPSEVSEDGTSYVKLARTFKSIRGNSKPFVIVLEIKVNVLMQQLKNVDLGEGSRLELNSKEGIVVASNKEGLAATQTTFTFMNGQEEPSNSLTTTDEKGNEILAVYSTLDKTGWQLIGTVPTTELVKDARSILILTIWSAVAVAVIALFIGLWLVRMIARPLSDLKNLMIEGSKGNLKVRSGHVSKDEIGELSGSFNTMMEQITNLVHQTNNTALEVLHTAEELSDASKKTAISAKEIAVATEEIANGASSLATEAERGNELTDHISRQMVVVVEANGDMGKAARHVESSSQNGTKQLSNLLDSTHQTEDMTRSLMHKVDGLKETTLSVNKVLEVLQNITKQTNILSLNATIEAARAGAAGRGFMVVADEIRQLAEQSKNSIEMVGDITDRIMMEMNETVKALSDAYPLFQHQMSVVQETNEIFVSVEGQMGDFIKQLDSVTQSIDGLNNSQSILADAMSNVSAVAEESSATSEEVASLSNEQQSIGEQLVQLSAKLEKVSNELKSTLSYFTM